MQPRRTATQGRAKDIARMTAPFGALFATFTAAAKVAPEEMPQKIPSLRANARATYAELARVVNLSAPAVHERVAKLEAWMAWLKGGWVALLAGYGYICKRDV